uniref:NADH dehydrogenase [ubiquinone] 1 beta subcomplex subunit 5, mitochondrial n=1 Tax=Haemonchus contortus TaxID=6289 RepID=A0A7I4Y6L2_HAECO
MTSLSKMVPVASRGLLKPTSFVMPAIRESHAALFRKRPAQLITNRIKDYCHFYFFGIGVFPIMLCLAYNHIVYGTCELRDYPEGEPPHYWQFERTPVRQWWAKHFGLSDIEHHERNLAYYEKTGIQARWRQIEERVKHLESERWDYKAWSYQPVSSTWVDLARWHSLRLRDQYEQHGHYPQ